MRSNGINYETLAIIYGQHCITTRTYNGISTLRKTASSATEWIQRAHISHGYHQGERLIVLCCAKAECSGQIFHEPTISLNNGCSASLSAPCCAQQVPWTSDAAVGNCCAAKAGLRVPEHLQGLNTCLLNVPWLLTIRRYFSSHVHLSYQVSCSLNACWLKTRWKLLEIFILTRAIFLQIRKMVFLKTPLAVMYSMYSSNNGKKFPNEK